MATVDRDSGDDSLPSELGWPMPDRLPAAAECTVRPLLERWAAETPDKIFAIFENGTAWSYQQALFEAQAAAMVLLQNGCVAGALVLNWLPNGPDQLRYWLGAAILGGVHVPIADTARAGELEHLFANSAAEILVTDPFLGSQLPTLRLAALRTVVVVGGGRDPCLKPDLPVRVLDESSVTPTDANIPNAKPGIADLALIIYTSGTTGAPKGVRNPYAQFWTLAKAQHGYLRADDRVLISTSLSHISTAGMVFAALFCNASVAIFSRFSARAFWDRVKEAGATAVPGMGPAMLEMLLKAPALPEDQDNPLRIINVRAPSPSVRQFAQRFAVDYYAAFGLTEASCVTLSALNSRVEGSCGRPRSGLDVRIVGPDDRDVENGKVGEIIFRSTIPYTLNLGYHREPEATERTWRNGWFHTGDLASRDEEGNLFFYDRSKDCIRRRGENVSSQEVEREALLYPSVAYAAAIGVPGAFEDQDILLVVEPAEGASIQPEDLAGFIGQRLAYFKVPRYISVQPEIPRTTFGKVRKFELAARTDLSECWDRGRVDDRIGDSPQSRRLTSEER